NSPKKTRSGFPVRFIAAPSRARLFFASMRRSQVHAFGRGFRLQPEAGSDRLRKTFRIGRRIDADDAALGDGRVLDQDPHVAVAGELHRGIRQRVAFEGDQAFAPGKPAPDLGARQRFDAHAGAAVGHDRVVGAHAQGFEVEAGFVPHDVDYAVV